jgi:hypothetical protein
VVTLFDLGEWADAGFAGQDGGPGVGDIVANGRDQASTGDDDALLVIVIHLPSPE